MPVSGFKHPRLWQYRFRPIPCEVLDRGWDDADRQWKRDVVEKLRRGGAAPQGGALTDLHTLSPYGDPPGGWKQVEEWAKNANRTNAVFLNDEAIARRLPEREAREKAYEEYLAEWAIRTEKMRARLEEQERERARVAAEEARRAMRRQKEKARREKEWAETSPHPRDERAAILRAKWQCDCGTIATVAWDSRANRFIVWCPVCDKTRLIAQEKLAARLYGRS